MAVTKEISGVSQKWAHCISIESDLSGNGKVTFVSNYFLDGKKTGVDEIETIPFSEIMPRFAQAQELRGLLAKLCETAWTKPTPPKDDLSILDLINR